MCEDNKVELMKLGQMVDLQEKALIDMNKKHETAVQRRNFLYVFFYISFMFKFRI